MIESTESRERENAEEESIEIRGENRTKKEQERALRIIRERDIKKHRKQSTDISQEIVLKNGQGTQSKKMNSVLNQNEKRRATTERKERGGVLKVKRMRQH